MHEAVSYPLAGEMRKIANRVAELPGIRLFAKPAYRQLFSRPQHDGNRYYGNYESFAQAKAQVPRTSLPSNYDTPAAGGLYRELLDQLRVADYPVLYWLSRLFEQGTRRVFDLGGHIGTGYYAFRPYLRYPAEMRWLVHDVPAVITAGRDWALKHDPDRLLAFTASRDDAEDSHLLLTSGALQYLDYTLPDLLQQLRRQPSHILVNHVPMHPNRGYFTLQNLGIAICPYRVAAETDFIASMQGLGYSVIDHWKSHERSLRVPFEPGCAIDSYHGFYFCKQS
jgi:putative methyltransferase (TIGR04325 family)